MSIQRGETKYAFNPKQYGNGRVLVAGGGISPFTMDNLTPDGWKTSKVNFPIAMHMGCTLALNTYTFLFVYGWDFKYSVAASTKTAYFNMDTQTLIEGPERMVRRATSMRTMFRVSTTVTYAVVAGGFIVNAELYLDSTEYLDVEKQQWKSGPRLPIGMQDGTMVEHPMGGILFAGGRKPNLFHPIAYGDALDTIYHLPTINGSWIKLLQRLKTLRSVSLLIPDEITSCSD